MPFSLRSSRRRYTDYRKHIAERRKAGKDGSISSVEIGTPGAAPAFRSLKRTRSFFHLLAQFWGMLQPYRLTILLALGALSLSTMLGLIPYYGTKIVIDNVLGDRPLPDEIAAFGLPTDQRGLLTFVAITMVIVTALSECVSLWSRWQATKTTKRVQVDAKRKVFEHAVHLPLHRVYELKSGGVASILREDAGGIGELVFALLYNPTRAIVQLLGSLVILAFVDWRLLLGSLALIPTVWLTHRTWINRIRPIFRDIRSTRQGIDAHATETFGGMRIVRSFSRQKSEASSFTNSSNLMARQEIFSWWWQRGIDVTWAILIPVATALLLYFGGGRVLADQALVAAGQIRADQAFTLGALVMFLSYLVALLGPIAVLANSATQLQNHLAGLDRILDLLSEPQEMPARPGAVNLDRSRVQGRISVRDLSFTYPKTDEPVLHKIHLEIAAGEIVALVGPSGAGKTTLCNLIARFFDATEGAILLDGVDLRDITVESYRRLLGIVEQDTFLFDGTIADNISYGRRSASLEEILRAAKLANAHGFIEKLPEKYKTLIGERGVKLSGGQRQRLTIARAILADPKILILDEATSNLDTESERLIQSSLQTLLKGRTCFIIAHRLSTISGADRIVVLENGKVLEQGKHEELMQRDTRYRDMVLLQTSPPPSPIPTRQDDLAEASA